MPSIRIANELRSGIYYLTFTVKNWYYIFDRHDRFHILANSIDYRQKHKQLSLYAYVFMINHIHLVATAPDMIAFVRDFKRHTSKEIQANIAATEPSLLRLFEDGKGGHELWAKTNMPKAIESEEFLAQKVAYVHNNPVRKQYVRRPEDWVWSSANPESEIRVAPVSG